MTHDEALAGLSSSESDVRLQAARYLAMNAVSADSRKLRAALGKESVPWIKRALERALERAGLSPKPTDAGKQNIQDPPPKLMAEVRAQVIDEVAGTVIHELSMIVASLKLSVKRDVPQYAGSRTETLVNSLASLLTGIRNIKAAASRANYSERDLAQECKEACSIFAEAGEIFKFAGPQPFLVEIESYGRKLVTVKIKKAAYRGVVEASTSPSKE